jgi:hypothetical protein
MRRSGRMSCRLPIPPPRNSRAACLRCRPVNDVSSSRIRPRSRRSASAYRTTRRHHQLVTRRRAQTSHLQPPMVNPLGSKSGEAMTHHSGTFLARQCENHPDCRRARRGASRCSMRSTLGPLHNDDGRSLRETLVGQHDGLHLADRTIQRVPIVALPCSESIVQRQTKQRSTASSILSLSISTAASPRQVGDRHARPVGASARQPCRSADAYSQLRVSPRQPLRLPDSAGKRSVKPGFTACCDDRAGATPTYQGSASVTPPKSPVKPKHAGDDARCRKWSAALS